MGAVKALSASRHLALRQLSAPCWRLPAPKGAYLRLAARNCAVSINGWFRQGFSINGWFRRQLVFVQQHIAQRAAILRCAVLRHGALYHDSVRTSWTFFRRSARWFFRCTLFYSLCCLSFSLLVSPFIFVSSYCWYHRRRVTLGADRGLLVSQPSCGRYRSGVSLTTQLGEVATEASLLTVAHA